MTQAEAFDILKIGKNVFLTGEPGAGKTYVINRYIEYLRAHQVAVAVTASTGIAATHIGGMTIHSWSGVGIRKALSKQDLDELEIRRRKVVRRVRSAHVLIIDEISMLDAQVLSAVDLACRTLRSSDVPFGGLQVVFVGDFFQLPPVTRDDDEVLAQFSFESPAWSAAGLTVCYISEQHRQDDSRFLNVLLGIRSGAVTEGMHASLSGRFLPPPAAGAHTKLFSHNVDVDRLNERELGKLPGEPHVFSMQSRGPAALVATLKRYCLSPEALSLKIGAKVMFTKNDLEGRYVNGTCGLVVGFDEETTYPIIEASGRRIEVSPDEWRIEEGSKVLARITQVPLRLAWAITVHKSQGMSLDSAIIDLRAAFEYGQGYVALSRVRSLTGLFLLGYNERSLAVHPDILERDAEFRRKSVEAEAAFAAIDQIELEAQQKSFIRRCDGRMDPAPESGAVVIARSRHGVTEVPLCGISRSETVSNGNVQNKSYNERLEQIREKYPNAYMPWSEESDRELIMQFHAGATARELVHIFKRQRGAIRSRLKKLGLIP